MAVTTPTYCSREDAQRAVSFQDGLTSQVAGAVDRAIQSAARNIEGHLHRLFYPQDATRMFSWPNYQYEFPWRLSLGRNDLLQVTSLQTGYGGSSAVTIALDQFFMCPQDRKPGFPFRWIELDRSTSAAWGGGTQTPQRSIQVTGTWGFTADADSVTTLSAAATDTATTVTVADGSQTGVGDLLILGYAVGTPAFPSDSLDHAGAFGAYEGERVIVSDKASTTTSLTVSSGCTTDASSDNQLTASGSGLNLGEVILIDAEQMLVLAVSGDVATVQRAWNGTVLGTHSVNATIYAFRSLTVLRGQLGTTAVAQSSGQTVYKHRVPSLIRDLAIAESVNRVLQETSGYARTVGGPDIAKPAPGMALEALWAEAETAYGRKARIGAI